MNYNMKTVNAPIALFQGDMRLIGRTRTEAGPGTLTWEWFEDRPQIVFRIKVDPAQNQARSIAGLVQRCYHPATLEIPQLKVSIEVFGMNNSTEMWGTIDEQIKFGDPSRLSKLTFYLANFWQYYGDETEIAGVSTRGQKVFEFGEWRLTLDQCDPDLFKNLRETGGVALTHTGCLERLSSDTFSYDQVTKALEMLRFFFGFCRGSLTPLLLRTGLDVDGKEVFNDWDPRWMTSSWKRNWNWFHEYAAKHLSLQGFWDKWQDDEWQDILSYAISGYCDSDGNPLNRSVALVLTQPGLEAIADKMSVAAAKAGERIRLLLGKFSIPEHIPAELNHLLKVAKKQNCSHGPQVFARLRNLHVHYSVGNGKILQDPNMDSAVYEAALLGLWYLELIIIALTGVTTKYHSRILRNKKLEDVPWRLPQK